MGINKNAWEPTDPDHLRFGQTDEEDIKIFYFRQFDCDKFPKLFQQLLDYGIEFLMSDNSIWDDAKYWIEKQIDLSKYTLSQMNDWVKPFYPSGLTEVVEKYGSSSEFIVADCIFEQQSASHS